MFANDYTTYYYILHFLEYSQCGHLPQPLPQPLPQSMKGMA